MSDRRVNLDHVLAFVLEHPWAVTDTMRDTIAQILVLHLCGEEPSPEALAAAADMRATRSLPKRNGDGTVAVIPIGGVISPRANMFTQASGGSTFDALSAQLREAVDNAKTKAIVFDVNSPGGNAAGASEFAREVMRARTKIPIIAHANHTMASAAYWPMAAATEIVASPSAMVGSIGVFTLHDDISALLAQKGIKRELFAAGRFKAEGADGGPLSPEARDHVKALVNSTYGRFVADVARGRGVAPEAIRAGYGEGRTLPAEAALEAGLIDRIEPFEDTLARVTGSATAEPARVAPTTTAATSQEPQQAATDQEPRPSLVAQLAAFERRVLELEL